MVKTRLAATCGPEEALQIYGHLVDRALTVCRQIDASRLLYYHPEIPHEDGFGPAFDRYRQVEGDLGAKMQAAFDQTLRDHDKAIIMGTDCPYITEEIIHKGFDLLDEADVVLGPALDGGYYLLGLRQRLPTLFQDMVWSTPSVYAETCARAEAARRTVADLPALSDIDLEVDWDRYLQWRRQQGLPQPFE